MRLAALLLLPLFAGQEVAWKSDWPGTLKEAAASKKLVVLVFFNKDVKNCKRYQEETLASDAVTGALSKYLCVRLDPEGTDDENRLWQQHGSPMPPMTFVYEPDGNKLTGVGTLNPKFYAEALNAIVPAYFDKIVPAREALAKDPNQPDKLADLGAAYVLLDNSVASMKNYAAASEALAGKGDKAGALKLLGTQLDAYYEKKWYTPARGCCARIAELDPDNGTKLRPKAAWVLGMAACAEGKWQEAIDGLTAANAKYKDCDILDRMMFTLGSAYMYAGEKDKAIATFDEIVKNFFNSEAASLAKIQADKLRAKK